MLCFMSLSELKVNGNGNATKSNAFFKNEVV